MHCNSDLVCTSLEEPGLADPDIKDKELVYQDNELLISMRCIFYIVMWNGFRYETSTLSFATWVTSYILKYLLRWHHKYGLSSVNFYPVLTGNVIKTKKLYFCFPISLLQMHSARVICFFNSQKTSIPIRMIRHGTSS